MTDHAPDATRLHARLADAVLLPRTLLAGKTCCVTESATTRRIVGGINVAVAAVMGIVRHVQHHVIVNWTVVCVDARRCVATEGSILSVLSSTTALHAQSRVRFAAFAATPASWYHADFPKRHLRAWSFAGSHQHATTNVVCLISAILGHAHHVLKHASWNCPAGTSADGDATTQSLKSMSVSHRGQGGHVTSQLRRPSGS